MNPSVFVAKNEQSLVLMHMSRFNCELQGRIIGFPFHVFHWGSACTCIFTYTWKPPTPALDVNNARVPYPVISGDSAVSFQVFQ